MSRTGPGVVIAGRYRLEELLGRGGMGSVWRAQHLELGSVVAIKLLEGGIGSDAQKLARFMREARAASALQSANVVKILDHGLDEGRAFIAMELLIGESLRARIARTNGMAAAEALRFVTQVLRAIHEAHEMGVVHRDLKPDNVFIVQGEPEQVKVLDFGIAKVRRNDLDASAGSVTQTGMMIGTPYYMSPEQAQAKEVDHRTDIWAIAVIAFEALTGRRPFSGDSFGELVISICTGPVPLPSNVTKVPRGFDEWFVHGTQRERTRRFQSAREMADELVKIATNITVPTWTIPSLVAPRTEPPAPLVSATQAHLELTTGQHSAVSGSSSARPRESVRAGLVALLGIGAVIVAGVSTFVLGGGASALRAREAAHEASRDAQTPRPAAAPVVAAPPSSAKSVRTPPSASVRPEASSVPSRQAPH